MDGMKGKTRSLVAAGILVFAMVARPAMTQSPPGVEVWSVRNGVATITFDTRLLRQMSVTLLNVKPSDPSDRAGELSFLVRPLESNLLLSTAGLRAASGFALTNVGALSLVTPQGQISLRDFVISAGPAPTSFQILGSADGQSQLRPVLAFAAGTLQIEKAKKAATIHGAQLFITPDGLKLLGRSGSDAVPIGTIALDLSVRLLDTGKTPPVAPLAVPHFATAVAAGQPDLTICLLEDFSQVGRLGDVAAFSMSTTSWNVGSSPLDWWPVPDSRHPVISLSVYRLEGGRFDQIGESWVKHGFLALNENQCSDNCSIPGSDQILQPRCTDTYGNGTNKRQSTLGPRSEVNAWTGVWNTTSSHFAVSHGHSPEIEHRLQIADKDLDPGVHPGARYFAEVYYVHFQDRNVMNNAAWKPIELVRGAPGGTWEFDMSGSDVRPTIGFAVDAWAGSKQTMFAPVLPPVKGQSPDGRGVLTASSKDLGNGTWEYDYAILNIDLDRSVKGFSIPIAAGTTVSNAQFRAAAHHDEGPGVAPPSRAISNAPWTIASTPQAVSWTTTTNPLRWGTLYSFSFTADRAPATVRSTISLFKQGQPSELTADTIGPATAPAR